MEIALAPRGITPFCQQRPFLAPAAPILYNLYVTTSLLQTKLFIPPTRPGLIPRLRLLEKLNAGLGQDQSFARKLTLVSAPAGFGKTTLVTEWLSQSDYPVAWLSLDEDDNDPQQFFSYLEAAVRSLPVHQQTLSGLLQSPQSLSPKSLITAFVNDVTAVSSPFLLVLDDYHVITNRDLHAAIAFLLDHMPPQMHLALTSRDQPDLQLPRLRARGQTTELGEADLRFTAVEAAQFLNQTMALSLKPAAVAALEARTEGWIAGLQLAALAMPASTAADTEAFINAFAGDHQYISDYLMSEVLAQRSPDTQDFLLQTAVLSRMNGDLCNALTDRQDGQSMLETLQQSNLFIIPLDDTRHWYRYHHLFSDFLRHRLQQTQPQAMSQLHQRASDWYGRHGFNDEAIHHALAAGDLPQAADLIATAGWSMLNRGEIPALRRWFDALPPDFLPTRPELVSIDVAAQFVAGLPNKDSRVLEAELTHALHIAGTAAMPEPQRDRLLGQLWGHQALIALNRADIETAIILCHRALEYTAADDDFLLAYIKLGLGTAGRFTGHITQAVQHLTEAIEHSRRAGSTLLALTAMATLSALYEVNGELGRAETIYRQALALAVTETGQPLPVAGMAYVGLAKVLRERNELETAVQLLDKAIELSRLGEMNGTLADGLITLGLVHRGQQDWAAAYAALDQAEEIMRHAGDAPNTMRIGAFHSRLQLAQGDITHPVRWAKAYKLTIDDDLSENLEIEHLTLARILIAAGQNEAALHLLTRLRQQVETGGRQSRLIETLVLQAIAQHYQAAPELALAPLARAVTLAEPEGFVRTFADEGEPVAPLLQRLKTEGNMTNHYVQNLQDIITNENNRQRTSRSPQPLLDPLKPRELQVLKLIAAGLSNKEIATELFLTVGTVKSYTHKLYGKLSVRRRTEAVERARELGLL